MLCHTTRSPFWAVAAIAAALSITYATPSLAQEEAPAEAPPEADASQSAEPAADESAGGEAIQTVPVDAAEPAETPPADPKATELDTIEVTGSRIRRTDYESAQPVLTLGVNNVLDQDPRISRGLSSLFWYNFDPNHYEAPGRLGYLRVGFKF